VISACSERAVFIDESAGEYVIKDTMVNKEKARTAIPRKSRIKIGLFSLMICFL
jgi:hypothetical protein